MLYSIDILKFQLLLFINEIGDDSFKFIRPFFFKNINEKVETSRNEKVVIVVFNKNVNFVLTIYYYEV